MSDLGISASSLIIAVVALGAVIMQLSIELNVEARRKGKTDRLALGDWAVNWPELKLAIFAILRLFRIPSPWGDPRILTVPFITVGEMEKYLRSEGEATRRSPLARRMQSRLVESATKSIITGDGKYTGRMYAVRGTTRKRSEACWADALDMCGMNRQFWSLLTGVSAQACDGAIRPANAVTNLHSLWGLGRIMGLRQVIHSGSRITMTNGGASLFLDLHTGVDRPTRLAHFSGSPNGRYLILEEMSQHTGPSIYADAVWAMGNVPDHRKLSYSTVTSDVPPSRSILQLPTFFPQPHVQNDTGSWNKELQEWATAFVTDLRADCATGTHIVDILGLVSTPVVVSCIRSFPTGNLSKDQLAACYQALLWCIRHWQLSHYQTLSLLRFNRDIHLPRLPAFTMHIGPEFVTGIDQAREWSAEAMKSLQNGTALIGSQSWKQITHFVEQRAADTASPETLAATDRVVVVKLLQCWKLMLLAKRQFTFDIPCHNHRVRNAPTTAESYASTAVLVALTMGSIAVATDSSIIGDGEVNKAIEIELGANQVVIVKESLPSPQQFL